MVQEYGRYFGMPTVCYRGGCLTGPNHSGAELHGFLAYLARCVREGRPYRVYGYKGKQVRDNIHSYDVCAAFLAFYEAPRVAAVYNLGGGRDNSVSVLEAVARFEELIGKKLDVPVRRPEPGRRPHLLHQRPAPAEGRLSRLGADALARRHPARAGGAARRGLRDARISAAATGGRARRGSR